MKPLSSFSRRNFLRTLAVTGLASGSAFAAPTSAAQSFNEVHDLVIVGSGFAGLDSIRDCIAFPKNNSGRDVMLDL